MEFIKMKLGTSLFYYIYIILCAGAFAALYFGLRHKSEKTKFRALYGILAFNFVLHFLKLALPYYYERGFPEVLRKCSFENICAVSTLIFPFAYLSKCNSIKDYMFYLGVISGIIGCVAPMPVIGLPFYHPEVIRYYICHASIWIVPLLTVIFGIHKLDYRRIWKVIAIYFGVLCLIIVNEIILIRLGWVSTSSFEEFFDPSERDMGYAIGFPHEMQKIASFIIWLTPKQWRNVPILWELFPVIVFGGLYMLFLCSYWEHEHIRRDINSFIDKIKSKRKKNNCSDDDV